MMIFHFPHPSLYLWIINEKKISPSSQFVWDLALIRISMHSRLSERGERSAHTCSVCWEDLQTPTFQQQKKRFKKKWMTGVPREHRRQPEGALHSQAWLSFSWNNYQINNKSTGLQPPMVFNICVRVNENSQEKTQNPFPVGLDYTGQQTPVRTKLEAPSVIQDIKDPQNTASSQRVSF